MKSLTPYSASGAIENSINGLFKNLTQGFDTSCVRGLNLLAWPPTGIKHLSLSTFTLQFKQKREFIFMSFTVPFYNHNGWNRIRCWSWWVGALAATKGRRRKSWRNTEFQSHISASSVAEKHTLDAGSQAPRRDAITVGTWLRFFGSVLSAAGALKP